MASHVLKRSHKISIKSHNSSSSAHVIAIKGYRNLKRGHDIGIIEKTNIPSQSLDHVDNPFHPLIYKEGVKLGGVGTLTGVFNKIKIDKRGIFAVEDCEDILSWNIQLDWSGGTFDIKLRGNHAVGIGSTTVCGLAATVTNAELEDSSEGSGTDTLIRGIFGSPLLNKQILLVSNRIAGLVTPNQYLQSPPTSQWSTCRGMALAIADFAGIDLTWYAPDAPLIDVSAESGQTVGDTLNSIASRVGANLVFLGGNNYAVATPDMGLGGFSIVDCSLIRLARAGSNADLTGSILLMPVSPGFDIGIKEMPASLKTISPPVEPLDSVRTRIKDTDAPHVLPKPGDVHELRARVLIPPEDDSAGSYFTKDKTEWFGITLPTVFDSDKRQYNYVLDHTAFDPNFKNGKHNFQLGYIRNTAGLEAAYQADFKESVQRQKILLQSQLAKIRYFENKSGAISFTYFGVMPNPHASIGFQKGDVSFSGIIKSVSFSSPDQMSLSCGNFVLIDSDTARSKLDFFTATGSL